MATFLTAIPEPENGWRLYAGQRPVEDGRDLHEAAGNRTNVLVGVPVSKAPTFLVVLPTMDTSLLRSMVYSQIEKRGLGAGSLEETIFDFDILEQEHGRTILAVHLIETPLPDDMILPRAAGYAPSAIVRQRIEDGAVLWKEHRQLVFAIFRGGRLLHSQVLTGAPKLGPATAQEINLLLLSLEGDPAFEDSMPQLLAVLLDRVDEAAAQAFASAVHLKTTFSQLEGAHRRARPRPALTPPPVLEFRRRRKMLVWAAAGTVLALIAYFSAGMFFWKQSKSNQQEIATLQRQIDLIRPDVEEIQRVESRWEQLEPAFDLKWFPIVQLSRITEALPGAGVAIREYRTRGRNIYIEGQARDVQLAFRLEEDLSKMTEFEHYEWSMPKPDMGSDNTARFQIEGKPRGE